MWMLDRTPIKNHFPDHPPYRPPRTGWLSRLASSWVPYIQLMRLDRPAGLTYFVLPHIYGTVHGALVDPTAPSHLFKVHLILFLGTIFMRGATCAWNDLVDAPFDRQVVRTRHRAIARGAVSVSSALGFIAVQSVLAAACLVPLDGKTAVAALPAILGWVAYPLMKRVMDYPQVFLGLPMAWGVIVGATAIGSTSLSNLLAALLNSSQGSSTQWSIIWLFAADAAWTLCYETMYSYQDVAYDEKAGVRSLALLVRNKNAAKTMLGVMAGVQVLALLRACELLDLWTDSWYQRISVLGAAVALAVKIWNVDLGKPESCAWWFRRGGMITGGTMLAGMVGSMLVGCDAFGWYERLGAFKGAVASSGLLPNVSRTCWADEGPKRGPI